MGASCASSSSGVWTPVASYRSVRGTWDWLARSCWGAMARSRPGTTREICWWRPRSRWHRLSRQLVCCSGNRANGSVWVSLLVPSGLVVSARRPSWRGPRQRRRSWGSAGSRGRDGNSPPHRAKGDDQSNGGALWMRPYRDTSRDNACAGSPKTRSGSGLVIGFVG